MTTDWVTDQGRGDAYRHAMRHGHDDSRDGRPTRGEADRDAWLDAQDAELERRREQR